MELLAEELAAVIDRLTCTGSGDQLDTWGCVTHTSCDYSSTRVVPALTASQIWAAP